MKSVELFTGAGGLGIGVGKAGFSHAAVVEFDRWCCDTIRENQRNRHPAVKHWHVNQMDVRSFDYSTLSDTIDLLAGGPPCQPFSLGGKHKAHYDERDMFPEVVRAMRELAPKAILIENVKGLLRRSFSEYLKYVLLQMTYPEVLLKNGESQESHFSRLEQHESASSKSGLNYKLSYAILNAANYGVPQKRERVFFVGFRSDLGIEWNFKNDAPPTHSSEALIWDKWISEDYWRRHKIIKPTVPHGLTNKIATYKEQEPPVLEAWRTVRDSIGDLPTPTIGGNKQVSDHVLKMGAREYKGHNGSPYDEPAKTLKAGVHGVPGGENMLRYEDGSVRYFTVRESARLQCFPEDYVFHGSWSEAMRQLGNAVPVELAYCIAKSVALKLNRR